ncbi:MAG TPA: pantoate--beta-alanine ligase [Pirellulales bacterium]|jgi:pantoate--beta-alanine ligase|nr:pantoate--beta-alanine ligase [Pirellulales bacterium]
MAKKATLAKAQPRVVRTLPPLKRVIGELRRQRRTIALVPTMGALHAGHLALVRAAQRRADCVIVSIFVNPTQFAPHEDLQAYPRTFATDLAKLSTAGVNLIWAPEIKTMYPEGFATRIVPEGAASVGLEDRFRPQFFTGVATVVAKLLIQCEPDIAMFGEKDYQQLKVVTQLVRDLGLKSRIVGIPTIREKDGLALSSRNQYLSEKERQTAPMLQKVLKECAAKITAGQPIADVLSKGSEAIAAAGFALDYLEARHAGTLAPISTRNDGPIRLLVAAKIGKTRLIDNMAV